MKKLVLFLCLLTLQSHAKISYPDSLKLVLADLHKQTPGPGRDTLIYAAMKGIMRHYGEHKIDSSFYYSKQLISFCQEQKLDRELTYAYLYIGYLYSLNRNFSQSIVVHYKALALAKKLNQHARIARALGGLAHAYLGLEKNEKALAFGRQGLAVLSKHPDPNAKASILNDIGAIYRTQGELLKALQINQELLTLARQHSMQWHEAQGLQAIGWVYKEMGNITQALAFSQRALGVIRQKRATDVSGRVDLEANILANIASIYIRTQKWLQALQLSRQVKEMALRLGNGTVLAESEEQLYQIYKHTGQTALALSAYEHFVFLRDSLSKGTNEQRIELLSAQYKYEQSQNELLTKQNKLFLSELYNKLLIAGISIFLMLAALLLWNNRRLQARNHKIDQQRGLIEEAGKQLADINRTLENRVEERTKELVDANNELILKNEEIKAALFKGQTIERKRVALELHDNLSSLLSAVNMNMQSINPQNLPVNEQGIYQNLRLLIQNAYAEVRNISHNILPAELEKEGLAIALTKRISQFNQNSALRINMTISGLEERLPVQFEVNIYSIVHELVNNAIKHAQASTITICLLRSTTDINLSVEDDGIGLGPQTPKRGVGFQNIQTRLDSLGGTLEIIQPIENGTRIDIKIPVDMV